MIYNKHYITAQTERIVDAFSTGFRQPQTGDICFNEQGGYQLDLYYGLFLLGVKTNNLSDKPISKVNLNQLKNKISKHFIPFRQTNCHKRALV